MKTEQQQTEKQKKNLTKPTEENKEKNLYFSTSMDCETHSFLIVAMQEYL